MTQKIIVVTRKGQLKEKSLELGNAENYEMAHEWKQKLTPSGKIIKVCVYVNQNEKESDENVNLFDFPPPLDTVLLYGRILLIAFTEEGNGYIGTDLDKATWKKFNRKLFGGFESLKRSMMMDEEEEDELAVVPSHQKTREGYLKDGFVVDDDDDEDDEF